MALSRRELIVGTLGIPLALFAGPAYYSSARAEDKMFRPIRQKPFIEDNPHEQDCDSCPRCRICLDTGPSTITVTINGVP